ncbi:MAG: SH3 domain-containing protein [Magnetococcales bacterium]|nr:SH3 domain-containing protein [Magnetococcales bacterium]
MLKTAVATLFLCIICLVISPGYLQAETLWAKKSGVKMTKESSRKSKTVTKLKKGVAVTLIKKSGRYYKVKLSKRISGWVYKYHLTNKAPKSRKKSDSKRLLATLGGGSAVSVHESSSSGSIRGMQATSQKYANTKKINKRHVQALKAMENFSVSDSDLMKFQKNGKIGEFSGARL